MRAFHGNAALKDDLLKRLKVHAEADRLMQGIYYKNGKGCTLGCALESDDPHSIVEERLCIPEELSRLIDFLFEELPREEALVFGSTWPEPIAVGADLSMVTTRFKLWLMEQLEVNDKYTDVQKVIRDVKELLKRRLAGDEPSQEEWEEVADEARAARAAAWAAARAAERVLRAARAARAAERVASRAAERVLRAARAAARVADEARAARVADEARAASPKAQADYLLKLLKEAV